MSRHVSDAALEKMHIMVTSRVRRREENVWLSLEEEALVEGHDLIALLNELRSRRGLNTRAKIGPLAERLIYMPVGDSIVIEPSKHGTLASARRTARKRLGKPDAVWHCTTLPDGKWRIERKPDGSQTYNPRQRPELALVAGLKTGESFVTDMSWRTLHGLKQSSRRILGDDQAQWRYQTLASGKIRIRRTR